MKFSKRCRPRTQDQANAWADELDEFRLNGISPRIRNTRQADIVAETLDDWIILPLTARHAKAN
jgi:hypothetical protein